MMIIGSLSFIFNVTRKNSINKVKNISVDVNGGADYTNIQEAINASNPGDIINIWNGTYFEKLMINKPITIIGNGTTSTFINGNSIGDVINISANGVTISGLTIENSGPSREFLNFDAAIEIHHAQNVNINNINLINNLIGIFLNHSDYNLIQGVAQSKMQN